MQSKYISLLIIAMLTFSIESLFFNDTQSSDELKNNSTISSNLSQFPKFNERILYYSRRNNRRCGCRHRNRYNSQNYRLRQKIRNQRGTIRRKNKRINHLKKKSNGGVHHHHYYITNNRNIIKGNVHNSNVIQGNQNKDSTLANAKK